jgi:antitoxin ParD1/3/4
MLDRRCEAVIPLRADDRSEESRMARVEKRTVSLRQEHAAYIDELVASGTSASASEVVSAGLRALEERDAAVSRWLRDEVTPVYDAMQAARDRAIPLDDVMTVCSTTATSSPSVATATGLRQPAQWASAEAHCASVQRQRHSCATVHLRPPSRPQPSCAPTSPKSSPDRGGQFFVSPRGPIPGVA